MVSRAGDGALESSIASPVVLRVLTGRKRRKVYPTGAREVVTAP
jgi:hypothetical protein